MNIGQGIFTWDGTERRSDRYGGFTLGATGYTPGVRAEACMDLAALKKLVGKRVRIIATVIESRKSDHCGDLFHKILPSRPEVGEVVNLGVGALRLETWDWDDGDVTAILLMPGDGRNQFWIDPRKMYRLHDQTVSVDIEITEDSFSTAPVLSDVEDGAIAVESIANGATLQMKGVDLDREEVRVAPSIERIGDGMFSVTVPEAVPGKRVRINRRPK